MANFFKYKFVSIYVHFGYASPHSVPLHWNSYLHKQMMTVHLPRNASVSGRPEPRRPEWHGRLWCRVKRSFLLASLCCKLGGRFSLEV